MLGLQGLGAIGQGLTQGAEELRKIKRDKREEEQYGWAKEDREKAKDRRKKFEDAVGEYNQTLEVARKGNLRDAFGRVQAFYNKDVPDGYSANLVSGADGSEYIELSNGKGDYKEALNLSPDLIEETALASLQSRIGMLSPEDFKGYVESRMAQRQQKQAQSNFERQLTAQGEQFRISNETQKSQFAEQLKTQKDQFAQSLKLSRDQMAAVEKQLEKQLASNSLGAAVYYVDAEGKQGVAYPRLNKQTGEISLVPGLGLPSGAVVQNNALLTQLMKLAGAGVLPGQQAPDYANIARNPYNMSPAQDYVGANDLAAAIARQKGNK